MACYWVIAVPFDVPPGGSHSHERERTYQSLRTATEEQTDHCVNYKFAVPELRVGTLDALLALSDDLLKTCSAAEQATGKVARQIADLTNTHDAVQFVRLDVDGVPVERYLTQFQWDEAKHPQRRPLKETVDNLGATIVQLEDDLKVNVSEYNAMKSAVSSLARKAQGSLVVRDLSSDVRPDQMVQSENLTTLLVVVPKFATKEWLGGYERLTQYVVPRSSVCLLEEADACLFRVVLFKRMADAFKTAASDAGFQVREWVAPVEGETSMEQRKETLERELAAKKAELLDWCKTAYSEVFGSWMHLVAVRLFVESILRYGLPPSFVPVVVKPHARTLAHPKALRGMLADQFGRSQVHWKDDEDAAPGAEEAYPYVSFTLNMQ